MKKYIAVLFLIMFIAPSVAFASWWNPFTWKIFKKKEPVPQVQVINTEKEKTPEEKIAELQKQLDELKNENKSIEPSKETDATKKVEVKKNTSSVSVKNTEQANKLSEQAKVEAELKAKFAEQDALIEKQRAEEKARLDAIDAKNALGKNYYQETRLRVSTLLGMEKTYKDWLKDTSDQFRTASLTLAGYSTGGLYGEARDTAIRLASAEISVISSLMLHADKWISAYENILFTLDKDSSQFINEETYLKIRTPEQAKNEIDQVKDSINKSLDMVLNTLKYH